MTTISVVVPTIGRDSLRQTLSSLKRQAFLPGDEVLIVGDGPTPAARAMVQNDSTFTYREAIRTKPCWGHSVRNQVNDYGWATGDFLVNLDDDDVLTDGAIATVRAEVAKSPTIPHLFQMDAKSLGLGLVWKQPWGIVDRNVSSANIVTPNREDRLGIWDEDRYNGDLAFIQQIVELHDGQVRWVPFVTHVCRPGAV